MKRKSLLFLIWELSDRNQQHSSTHKVAPLQQCCRKVPAVDAAEQYKRDLQLQIEQNRCRREEELQRELEMERREMIK